MRIEELHLNNFRCFKELDIQFPESNLAVFIGNNGAGKTAILESLAISLSWLVARIKREKGSGSPINELDILNDENFSQIAIAITENDLDFYWTLAKTAKGKKSDVESSLTHVTKLADVYRTKFTENKYSSFPLIIYYPVERSVFDIPLKVKTGHGFEFEQLDGYDNEFSQGLNFRHFFEWFRDREDVRNEAILKLIDNGKTINSIQVRIINELGIYGIDIHLNAVETAINTFMPEFSNLRIERKPRLRMLVDKKGCNTSLNVLQLSQGEKLLMALVGDIARRLTMMNPRVEKPLDGNGIVIIDEIELHLHPQWQREVLPALQKTFPNIQFIVTTHSPQVLSRVHRDDIFILKDNQLYKPSSNPIGRDSSDILDEIMEVTKRPQEIQELSDKYFSLLNRKLFEEAQTIRNQLLDKLDSKDPLFIRADAMITRMQLLKK